MKLLLSLLQTSRPSSLPILITDKPGTRHLTDKVYMYIQMGKFTLFTALGANFFIQSQGS